MQINSKTDIFFKQAIIIFFSVSGYINFLVSILHRAKQTENSEDNLFIQKEVSSSLDSVGFCESITDEEALLVFCKVIQESKNVIYVHLLPLFIVRNFLWTLLRVHYFYK